MELDQVDELYETEDLTNAEKWIKDHDYILLKIHCGEKDIITDLNKNSRLAPNEVIRRIPYTKYILGKKS